MNFKLFFLFIILFSNIVYAQPNIIFQNEELNPLETVIASISEVEQIKLEQIKVYEDRREISFEKGVIYINNTSYIYLIPTKEGTFRIEIKNVLYRESEILTSSNLEKTFVVNSSDSQDSEILTIRPGVVYSALPVVYLVNSGEKSLEVSYGKEKYNLGKNTQQKIELENKGNFYFAEFKTYKTFSVPVIFINQSANLVQNSSGQNNSSTPENNTPISENNTNLKNISYREIEKNLVLNETQKINISLDYGPNSNLTIKTSSKLLRDYSLTKELLVLDLFSQTPGFFSLDIEIYSNGEITENVSLKVVFLKNETELIKFEESKTEETCKDLGGNLCEVNQNCEGEFVSAQGICCFVPCTTIDEEKKDPMDYLIGIFIICILSFVAYLVYKKNKNLKLPGANEKFNASGKIYENRTLGK